MFPFQGCLCGHDDIKGHTVWQDGDDSFHFLFKSDLQYAICLVNDESPQIPEDESFGILTGALSPR